MRNLHITIPPLSDPRWTVLGLLTTYIVMGITILGFNREPEQIALIVLFACSFDMLLHYLIHRKLLFPLSAAITGCGLSILVNYSHGIFLPFIPVFFAIASKHIITANGRHVFNPALFGVVAGLKLGEGMITPSPSYQWGGTTTIAIFIVTAALLLFVKKIHRNMLILSFLGLYTLELVFRAILIRDILPPHMLFIGAFANPAFYLFTFFMITDPVTSPNSKKGQFIMSLVIVLVDLLLHIKQTYATLFFAGFTYFSLRWLWLQGENLLERKNNLIIQIKNLAYRTVIIASIGCVGMFLYKNIAHKFPYSEPDFKLTHLDSAKAGISTHPSKILEQVDPRVQNVAKWLLSVGDAVAAADVNNDGLMDIFLTYTLKDPNDRAALYINKGNYKFERFPIPFLTKRFSDSKNGVISGALWFDYDNDGDQDVLIMVGYGKSILLNNMLKETGKLSFVDVSDENGFTKYNTTSLTANVLDMTRDGKLDIIIANAIAPYLKDYNPPVPLNIFNLPEPEYKGDRRMFNFMHRTWYDAQNGGGELFYHNTGNGFVETPSASLGLDGTRWSLSLGTGDFNNDGWTDLYSANDFGPDDLFINRNGKKFEMVKGALPHHIGRDVYKSMNASVADFDGNGFLDIYTSNVHHKLQAEGSQLWLNDGKLDTEGYAAFTDDATYRNALNENRFGWGGSSGDINMDGRIDIIQANGMVNDSYDHQYTPCPDYWYLNEKIALTRPEQHGYSDNWADLRGRCIFPDELNRVYLNEGKYFIDVAEKVGMDKKGTYRGVALVDLNNEGHLDVIVTDQFGEVSIYKNEIAGKSWIGLKLEGDGKNCNKDGIGTKITLEYDVGGKKVSQVQEKHAANGFSAQGDPRLFFGLGEFKGQQVTANINWCGNPKTEVLTLDVKQYKLVRQ